jgi:hypothetical protein
MSEKSIAYATYYAVLQNSKRTLVQDAYHLNSANFEFAYSDEALEAYVKAGKKHFACELMREPHQKYIDALLAGTMPEKEFKQHMMEYWIQQPEAERTKTVDAFTHFVKRAHDKGIKVHAVDELGDRQASGMIQLMTPSLSAEYTVDNLRDRLQTLDLNKQPEATKLEIKNTLRYLSKFDGDQLVQAESFQQRLETDFATGVLKSDQHFAARLQQVCGDEPTVVMLGILHGALHDGRARRDLDELWKMDGKVMLTPSSDALGPITITGTPFNEIPTTLIYTDHSAAPGKQIRAEILRNKPALGGEARQELNTSDYRPILEGEVDKLKLGELSPASNGVMRAMRQIGDWITQ